jgi:hypothetical protein
VKVEPVPSLQQSPRRTAARGHLYGNFRHGTTILFALEIVTGARVVHAGTRDQALTDRFLRVVTAGDEKPAT